MTQTHPPNQNDTNRASIPRETAKRHQSLPLRIANPLIVNQPNPLFQNGVQHLHVSLLRLDSVTEKHIRLVLVKLRNRHLLDSNYQITIRDILLQTAPHRFPLRIRENSEI